MDVKIFKDKLFDLLNDSECMNISDIDTDDKNNIFTIRLTDGNIFEIECRQFKIKNDEQKMTEKLLDILANERINNTLNILLKNNLSYLNIKKCQEEESKKVNKLNLNKKQARQINKLITAINQGKLTYGFVAYQLGFQDGIKLSDELRQII